MNKISFTNKISYEKKYSDFEKWILIYKESGLITQIIKENYIWIYYKVKFAI
jgi:hypothetical protein